MFILLWIILGSISAYIAETKGQKVWINIIVSVFLTPISGIILAAASPKNIDVIKQRRMASGIKKCPQCAELVKSEAKKCRFCGSEII